MTNLTIALDETVIRQARIRAIQEGTSVSAKVREFLTEYAQAQSRQQAAGEAFLASARASNSRLEGGWNREALYDRPYRQE